VIVIPNAAPTWADRVPSYEGSIPSRRIVAVGRLSEEKGFHALIEAFRLVAPQYPDWTLTIFGEGDERGRLERLVQQSQLAARVHLPGWTEDVKGALLSGELFVLPSRYEGFPNALLEAMAVGLPCISFDCDSGPREIIRHGMDGLLVPAGDVRQLAEALASLMGDPSLRQKLGSEARNVVTRFSREAIYGQWDQLLDGS
jgi:glycosyltransferase involved in cell wall biosynthesis